MRKAMISMVVVLLAIAVVLTGFLFMEVRGAGVWIRRNESIFSFGEPPLVNRQELSLEEIEHLEVLYISERIEVLKSDSDKLVLEEYMNDQDARLQAVITWENGTLKIKHGDRNFLGELRNFNSGELRNFNSGELRNFNSGELRNFNSYVKLYLPTFYTQELTLSTTSGSILSDLDLELRTLRAQSTSGSIRLDNTKVQGVLTLETVSGDIEIHEATAGGAVNCQTNSGRMEFGLLKSEQELKMDSVSGKIRLGTVEGKSVELGTTSGAIEVDDLYSFSEASLNSTGGRLSVSRLIAPTIHANTTSSSIDLGDANGTFQVNSTSGALRIHGSGHGEFRSGSGRVDVTMTQVDGDLDFNSTSGKVELTLPADHPFEFEAQTVSGQIQTDFDSSLTFNKRGNQASGGVGSSPVHRVRITATSGGVMVQRQAAT